MASALPVSGLRQREGMPLGRVAKAACHVRAEYSRCPPGRGRRRSRSRETAPPWFPSLARSRPNSCTVSGFVPAARPRLRYSSTSRSLQSTMAPLEHRLPDAGTTPKGHDHRSSRLGGERSGPDFGGIVTRWPGVPSIYSIVPPNDGSALRHGHHFEPVDFIIDHGRGHHDAYSAGSCQRTYARACGCRQRPRRHREELIESERGWSGREAFVTMMQTADLGQGNDRSGPGRLNGSSIRCVLAERQVGPWTVIIVEV